MQTNKTISNIDSGLLVLKGCKFSLLVGLCNASGELMSNGGCNKITWFFFWQLKTLFIFLEVDIENHCFIILLTILGLQDLQPYVFMDNNCYI